MTTTAIPMPAGAVPADGLPPSTPAPNAPPTSSPAGATPMPSGAVSADQDAIPDPNDPSVSGEITNDVGNKVIVPKDGEEFGDTIKRAIAYQRSLTPQQRQDAVDKEMATAPKKAAETMGAAAGIGFLGPALLAAPGEALMETHAAVSAGIKAFMPALTSGVVAVGKWAAEHPVAAKAIWETLKMAMTGTAIGAASKVAGKIINANPD